MSVSSRLSGNFRWLLLIPVALLALTGCEPNKPAKSAKNPRVEVTRPIMGKVMDYQDFTGRLEPVKNIEVRARASGYVMEAKFKEGDLVQKYQVLFQIEEK